MWLIVLPIAAAAGALLYKQTHPKPAATPTPAAPPVPQDPIAVAAAKAAALATGNAFEFPDAQGKFTLPGATPTVDGHGTGVLFTTTDKATQEQEAAKAAAELVAKQNQPSASSPEGTAAGLAAEAMKNQIITALNTPQTDRTPEQLALLNSVSALPEFAQS